MTPPKKPPRTKIPRVSRWHFKDGTVFDQDAVERAMQEIRSTVEFLALWEKETAPADAKLEEQRAAWKEIFAAQQAGKAALRRLAEQLVVAWVVLARPGGRTPSDHREAWLTKYDARREVDKSSKRLAICRQIYDAREEEFQTPIGSSWRQASFETLYRYILRHREK